MDVDVLRLVRAIAHVDRTMGIHPVGVDLEKRICAQLRIDTATLNILMRKAAEERCLVAPGETGPDGFRRLHRYHLSAKGWGLAAVLAA